MYAVVVHVKLDPSQQAEAERMLHEEVVPSVKQAPVQLAGIELHEVLAQV